MSSNVPEIAVPAWQAFSAMQASKQRYFTYLQALENCYKKYGEPNATEQRKLAELLADHNTRIAAFKAAIRELRAKDTRAHDDLLEYIAKSDVMAPPSVGHRE